MFFSRNCLVVTVNLYYGLTSLLNVHDCFSSFHSGVKKLRIATWPSGRENNHASLHFTNLWLVSICHSLFCALTLSTLLLSFQFFLTKPLFYQDDGYCPLIAISALLSLCSSTTLSTVRRLDTYLMHFFI